jgi:hypothetical protein
MSTTLQEAEVVLMKAQAVRQLIDAGFPADRAVDAVESGDMRLAFGPRRPPVAGVEVTYGDVGRG